MLAARASVVLPLVLLLSLLNSQSVFAGTIFIQPPATVVAPGQSFSLGIAVSGVTDLFAYQFDIGFDPGVLAATGITEGSFLPTGGPTLFLPGTIDNIAGTITFTAGLLLGPVPGVNGSGTLATIDFEALALGTSAIGLSGGILLDSTLAEIGFASQGGSVTVAPRGVIPEPSTAWLFGAGLIALGASGRIQRRPSRG